MGKTKHNDSIYIAQLAGRSRGIEVEPTMNPTKYKQYMIILSSLFFTDSLPTIMRT